MPPRAKSRSEFAKAVDRQLERYRSMRDFQITSEPAGSTQGRGRSDAPGPQPFVVQKHAATRLHYDFRLGWHGVLKSWAVTKGPSYFPGDKRLAVEVEDHPMEYGGFEGTIPKGQYGGGTVMIWDYGEWKGLGNVERELEKGNLKFELNGTKLKGKWALVRMKNTRDRSDKPNWLLIKERDEWAQPEEAPGITELAPDSAITQRTMEQIAESRDHVWDSKQGLLLSDKDGEPRNSTHAPKADARNQQTIKRLLRQAPREVVPGFIEPQLARQGRKAPAGNGWIHELKLDGYRIQIHVAPGSKGASDAPAVTLFTRTGLDWTHRVRSLAQAAAKLKVESCILDGEFVALDHEGRSNFSDLQAAFQEGKQQNLVYFAFDLLHLNGHNVRKLPLVERKAILAELFSQVDGSSALRLSEHIEGRGSEVFAKACELGAEGVVSKLSSAPYTSGRGNAWLKMKCALQQEFVIGGFTPPERGGRGIGALLLGYYEDGKLRYAGRVGTGFSDKTHGALRDRLDPLVRKTAPFEKVPSESLRKVSWVKPELVAQVRFSAWTRDNLIRQSSFRGLREDKTPKEVTRETPDAKEDCRDCPPSLPDQAAASQANRKTTGQSLNGVRLTHPGKVIDAQSGVNKKQVAEYYLAVSEHILPHIADRPLSVVRCPDGIGKPCFFQKHVSSGLPAGVSNVSIPNRKTGKEETFLTVNTLEGLLGLAQLGVLEIHPWGSKNDSFEKPDRIIFDLDPDEAVPWNTLAAAAEELRDRLKQLELTSFVKSTGGKGLHVVVPIQPKYEWPIIKQFSHAVALQMERSNPGLYLTKMTKAARTNRIYLDYLRNDREATAIAPFSTRARPGVPVAVTLEWKELRASGRPRFYVSNFADWKSRLRHDPWQPMIASKQVLQVRAIRALGVKVN
jgi:bifunctional non-homologous end joining protein LigD